MEKEESLRVIKELALSQDFDPLWNFTIPIIEKIIDEYYKNSKTECSVHITDNEKEIMSLVLSLSINIIRDILDEANVKCGLILLDENNLKVFFDKRVF